MSVAKKRMKTLVNKSALEKLKGRKGRPAPGGARSTQATRSERTRGGGFAVGPGGSISGRRMRSKNLMLDPETLEGLDDLCYELKKTLGRRVSASELVRAAFRAFQDLPEQERLRLLAD